MPFVVEFIVCYAFAKALVVYSNVYKTYVMEDDSNTVIMCCNH